MHKILCELPCICAAYLLHLDCCKKTVNFYLQSTDIYVGVNGSGRCEGAIRTASAEPEQRVHN